MQNQSGSSLFTTQLSQPAGRPWTFVAAFFLQSIIALLALFLVPEEKLTIAQPHYHYANLTAPLMRPPAHRDPRPIVNSPGRPKPAMVVSIRNVARVQPAVASSPILPPPILAATAPLLPISVPQAAVVLRPAIHVNVLETPSAQVVSKVEAVPIKTGVFEVTGTAGTGNHAVIRAAAVIQQAGFNLAAPENNSHRLPAEVVSTSPVAIQSKPTPAYTEEARQLHIEGEVLLNVVFTARGQVQVLQVVKGLGHGLDEAAVHAAERIHFAPAERAGKPVDCPATLHIIFSLS
jgi:TonB family protein